MLMPIDFVCLTLLSDTTSPKRSISLNYHPKFTVIVCSYYCRQGLRDEESTVKGISARTSLSEPKNPIVQSH